MRFNKYTKEALIEAVASSASIRQVLITLNVAPYGGNYAVIKNYIKKLNLDTSHFRGQGWNKDLVVGPKRPVEDYLSNQQTISSHKLRQRLIKEKIFNHECHKCNNSKWLDNPIPLELHHIDGDSKNNTLINLQLLCPNCHSLTPNFRNRKNKNKVVFKRSYKKRKIKQQIIKVKSLTKNYNLNSKKHLRKTERPSYEQLKQDLAESNYCAVGRKYGVSDNAIRKWIKHYEKHQKLGSALSC